MKAESQWIEHEYVFTYRIAARVESTLSRLRGLEPLTLDGGIWDFIPHWQKDTALHKLIRYVADDLLSSGRVRRTSPWGDDLVNPKWAGPIEVAMMIYGMQDVPPFEPPDNPFVERRDGNVTYVEDAPELTDAYYERVQSLRLTQIYDDLLRRIADEVFFVMFTNRVALQHLHSYLALHVNEASQELDDSSFLVSKFYTKAGKIRRVKIPKWACRAIFFRDRGLCVKCDKDISGLVNRFSLENFDHIVPLAAGGLNDITNLQLLCADCNNEKSARVEPASNRYQRWY
ncbi:HNH endonuclease [Streptomyces bobili]|uniref:HNH endonuclease n=1 Tax=Streptomyces bobili TaxID=67280 RepID=UPI0036621996